MSTENVEKEQSFHNSASKFQHYMDNWTPSDDEKDLLRRTFNYEFDFLYDLGCNIYLYIFDKNPHVRELFPKLLPYGAAFQESHEFRSQALRFAQAISQTVRNIYHLDQLTPVLRNIGARHVKYLDRGFRSEYWDAFQDAIQVALCNHIAALVELDEQQRVDSTRAWRTLALFIIVHMKHGFYEELVKCGKHEEGHT